MPRARRKLGITAGVSEHCICQDILQNHVGMTFAFGQQSDFALLF
jgi:hypothetical protein